MSALEAGQLVRFTRWRALGWCPAPSPRRVLDVRVVDGEQEITFTGLTWGPAKHFERVPQRLQLSRRKGYRKPEGAIVVSRPSKWGNPFRVIERAQAQQMVDMFRSELVDTIERPWDMPHAIEFRVIAESLEELSGKDLACWCALSAPCHADVLIELANR